MRCQPRCWAVAMAAPGQRLLGTALTPQAALTPRRRARRYIVAASKCQQFGVVEQMTRESTHMDVDKVVGFLMDAKLADARPLINVCDRFDRVTELTKFLYENNLLRCAFASTGHVSSICNCTAPHASTSFSNLTQAGGKVVASCMYRPERDPELKYSVHRTACFGARTALQLLTLLPPQVCACVAKSTELRLKSSFS